MKAIYMVVLALVLAAAPIFIQAASAWNLFVTITGAQFGHSDISVSVKTQYGIEDSKTIPNGPNAQAVFELPDDRAPIGSTYEVCGHSEGIMN
jgi:hypothetical protein